LAYARLSNCPRTCRLPSLACSLNGNLERLAVEKGFIVKLLDIICNEAWPPSVRDMAGGCLGFMSERYSNMLCYPIIELPTDIKWPLQVGSVQIVQDSCHELNRPMHSHQKLHRSHSTPWSPSNITSCSCAKHTKSSLLIAKRNIGSLLMISSRFNTNPHCQ
jgi:hypothetical protein